MEKGVKREREQGREKEQNGSKGEGRGVLPSGTLLWDRVSMH